jgi:hypothetical protein
MPGSTTLLLPARAAFAGRDLPRDVALALGRSDAVAGESGDKAQLQRHFILAPRAWPVAALTRVVDGSDAGDAQWLRADPAWIRPDINGARLFAVGEGLRLSRGDADALLPALRPLFGDAGMPIDAPHPSRWYLRIPPGATLPSFADPADALGSDLGDAAVEAGSETGEADAAGTRRWRTLLSEAQVVLHNHPWNARRAAEGKPPVNSLWFWGGGTLPANVETASRAVHADDALLGGLATCAGIVREPASVRMPAAVEGDALFDLRAIRDADVLVDEWLRPALQGLRQGGLRAVQLDFADGAIHRIASAQRRRFWRRPRVRLA